MQKPLSSGNGRCATVAPRSNQEEKEMKIARRTALGLLSALPLLCALPAPVLAQGTPQTGGTLVMVVQPEPPTLASYQALPVRSDRWRRRSTKAFSSTTSS